MSSLFCAGKKEMKKQPEKSSVFFSVAMLPYFYPFF